MYSLHNLTKVDVITVQARSETYPECAPYTITVSGGRYRCSCPAARRGRSCKHVRTLLRGRAIWAVLHAAKPDPAAHCHGMDGWCSYPRLRLWQAVSDMAWQEEGEPRSLLAYAGIRAMYLCDDCRAWGEDLARRVGQARAKFERP